MSDFKSFNFDSLVVRNLDASNPVPKRPTKKPATYFDFQLKYKTELCKKWRTGGCTYKENCAFAHGAHELREKVHLPENYRTRQCAQYFTVGYCIYGSRCQFSHIEETHTAPSSKESSRRGSIDEHKADKYRLPVFIDLETRGYIAY